MAEVETEAMTVETNHTNGNGELVNGIENGNGEDDPIAAVKDDSHPPEVKDKEKEKHHDKERDHHHKSSHKDKERDKDRDRHRDKDRHSHKSSHKDKDRDREKHHDKDRHKDRDKDKERHRDKDSERGKDKDKHRSKDKERSDKDKERSDKDRHKERSDKDRDKERSDKVRHKERSDKDRDKERSGKDKERSERDKDRSDKDKERRDKDKERRDKDRSDKHKDKDKEKSRSDKEKHSSSSSKSDKDRSNSSSHKSSHKDKQRDKDRDKEKKLKEKEVVIKKEPQESEENNFESAAKSVNNTVNSNAREEIESPVNNQIDAADVSPQLNIKNEPIEERLEDDDVPLVSRKRSNVCYKEEEEDEDDVPLVARKRVKKESDDEDFEVGSDEDDVPLASRKKPKKEEPEDEDDDDIPLSARKKMKSHKKRKSEDDEDEEDFKPSKKKAKVKMEKPKSKPKVKKEKRNDSSVSESPTKTGRAKKKEEDEHVWKWWEEEKRDDGTKWKFLEHKGPVFADPYERLPSDVKFYYNGEHFRLSKSAEEVAGFYAKMLEHDYTTKEMFNKNFFKDWRKFMTEEEKTKLSDFSKCDFRRIHAYYVGKNEERKNRTKEEKKMLKEKNEAVIAEYGWCMIDGHKQRIGNFKIEPPGLFRGRGEHPKQGMVKRRTQPEDVIINCSKDSQIPKPPEGHKWKQVRHDPNVTWLACWNENIQNQTKYVMLNAASKLKGEKDWQKYETARRLHKHVDSIRESYRADWKSKEMRIRQRGVALYFIDKLALRAGNEKDEDQADTVGCCSLRVEHIELHEEKDGKDYVVVFDFLGKDSIRYYNQVQVEKRVFKNLQLFMDNKQEGDDLFDRLNTQILNKYLNELLEGLTAKVFRTYNASRTLQEQLNMITDIEDEPVAAQILAYNRANREVAILCNHQRAVPKTFDQSMANLQKKIDDKRDVVHEAEKEMKELKRAAKHGGSVKEKTAYEKKKKAVERLKDQLNKLELSQTDKEENKQIALGTSKLNYLDPRITVAWCKKNNIPVDKVYNKTQRQKFQWAIDMATADYNFLDVDENQTFGRNGVNEDDEEEED